MLTSLFVVISVFGPPEVDQALLKGSSSGIQTLEAATAFFQPDEVQEGHVIGAAGAALGRQEERDWRCSGVVEALCIQ